MRIASIGLFVPEYPISLANALARDNEVTLFLSRRSLAEQFPGVSDPERWLRQQRLVEPGVRLNLVDYPPGRYPYKLWLAVRITRTLTRMRPDVLHYQSGGDPWLPLTLPWLRHVPKVVTIHDVIPHPGDFPPARVIHLLNWFSTRWASQLIVHGEQQATALHKNYRVGRSKINVVPHGAYSIYKQSSLSRLPEEPNLILFFGRIVAYKGLNDLMAAVPLVLKEAPEARFLIAGHGDGLNLDETDGDSNRVMIRNEFIPMHEVGGLFQRAAIVVIPYTQASQSGVVHLAYAFGKPVVSTRVGSIPEVVDEGRTGYLVEPGNPKQLAAAIVKLLKNPEQRHEMGQRALHKSETELSWDQVARKTMRVYRRAMERVKP
jgi:glycosyltransferase involved in cell wall biosynthesis